MISFEQAEKIVLKATISSKSEQVTLLESIDRVLAENIFSDINIPPFNKSAVDGFACKYSDFESRIKPKKVGVIAAGDFFENELKEGECVKIMTGAKIPDGADCVVMVEDVIEYNDFIEFIKEKTSLNICFKAEDIKENEIVLKKGIKIKPQHIAVLASVGAKKFEVSKKPVIGILSTGNELVEPEIKPFGPFIRNSNALQLYAQIIKSGAIPNYFGIVKDDRATTLKFIKNNIEKCDILILTGGVSAGEFDFVPDILTEIGSEILFKSIAVQPGKPTVFSKYNDKYIFGLPGNPVSAFVQFELLVKLLINKYLGLEESENTFQFVMGTDIVRKKTERKAFLPVLIRKGEVFPVDYNGSAHIHSYTFADGMVTIEQGGVMLKKGDFVNVRLI